MRFLKPKQLLSLIRPYGAKLLKSADEHKAEILLVTDIAMTTGAVIFSATATPKALELRDARKVGVDETKAETVAKDALAMAPAYLPTAILWGGSVASAVGGYKIQSGKLHTLATALSLAEHMAVEYQDRVVEQFGDEANRGILKDIADSIKEDDVPFNDSYCVGANGEIVYYDTVTGMVFTANDHIIDAAVGHVNTIVCCGETATIVDFYDYIPGVEYKSKLAEEAFWSQYSGKNDKMMVRFSTTLEPDGKLPKKAIFYDYDKER